MVFRSEVRPGTYSADELYKHGLVVFLVGEQPTKGIDDAEFSNALGWLQVLDPSGNQPLRIRPDHVGRTAFARAEPADQQRSVVKTA